MNSIWLRFARAEFGQELAGSHTHTDNKTSLLEDFFSQRVREMPSPPTRCVRPSFLRLDVEVIYACAFHLKALPLEHLDNAPRVKSVIFVCNFAARCRGDVDQLHFGVLLS